MNRSTTRSKAPSFSSVSSGRLGASGWGLRGVSDFAGASAANRTASVSGRSDATMDGAPGGGEDPQPASLPDAAWGPQSAAENRETENREPKTENEKKLAGGPCCGLSATCLFSFSVF